ncbi:hypothetical protein MHYP_G00241280 [Metynnis hypsauchen]
MLVGRMQLKEDMQRFFIVETYFKLSTVRQAALSFSKKASKISANNDVPMAADTVNEISVAAIATSLRLAELNKPRAGSPGPYEEQDQTERTQTAAITLSLHRKQQLMNRGVLVVQLKRFQLSAAGIKKQHDAIHIDTELQLSLPVQSNPVESTGHTQKKRATHLFHLPRDTPPKGHYLSDCSSQSDSCWLSCGDVKVTLVTEEQQTAGSGRASRRPHACVLAAPIEPVLSKVSEALGHFKFPRALAEALPKLAVELSEASRRRFPPISTDYRGKHAVSRSEQRPSGALLKAPCKTRHHCAPIPGLGSRGRTSSRGMGHWTLAKRRFRSLFAR